MQLDLILQDEDYPDMKRLCTCLSSEEISSIADVKGNFL